MKGAMGMWSAVLRALVRQFRIAGTNENTNDNECCSRVY